MPWAARAALQVEGDVLAAHVRKRAVQRARAVSTMTGTRSVAVPLPSMTRANPSSRASCAVPGPTAMIGSRSAASIAGLAASARSPLRLVTISPATPSSAVGGDRQVLDAQQRLDRHLMAERFELRAQARRRRARAW